MSKLFDSQPLIKVSSFKADAPRQYFPKASPEVAAKHITKIAAIQATPIDDCKAWAKKLVQRYMDGEHLMPVQINLACDALGIIRKDLKTEAQLEREGIEQF